MRVPQFILIFILKFMVRCPAMMLSGIQRKALTRTGVLRTRSLLGGRLLTTSTASEPTSFSFENIVSEQLFQALSSQNFLRATPIQSMSYSAVRSGNDVVIGAETGSGKTLAYLLPIVDEILSISSTSVIDFPLGFILTPNKELCNQVEQMSHGLIQALNGRGADIRIQSVTEIVSAWRWTGASPHFVICTPRFLANFVRGPVIKEEELFRNIHCLVLDEADMLLDGSYLRDVETIMDALKITRRGLIREGVLQVHEKRTQFILSAATIPSFGLKSVKAFVIKRFPKATFVRTDNLHMHHPCIRQEFVKVERLLEGDGACGAGGTGTRGLGSVEHVLAVVRAIISDAAPTVVSTVPSAGGADAAPAVVADGERKEGKGIASTHNNLISQSTISLGDLQRFHQGIPPLPLQLSVEEVQAANSLDHLVMVFLNTAEDAQRFADAILNLGVQCAQFHGLLRGAERAESLRLFREGAVRILVCTDSAARGLDLPMVRHVLQADFALNVVQHQHRVGRASRAGRAGRATNFYWGDRANALVESILGMTTVPRKKQLQEQQTVEKIRSLQQGKGEWEKSVEGTVGSTEEVFVLNSMPTLPDDEPEEIRSPQSIDQSFSRRRGFRRNMKRLGKKATETSMQPNY